MASDDGLLSSGPEADRPLPPLPQRPVQLASGVTVNGLESQAEALRSLAGDGCAGGQAPAGAPLLDVLQRTLAASARAGRARVAELATELIVSRAGGTGAAPSGPSQPPRRAAVVARELVALATRLRALQPGSASDADPTGEPGHPDVRFDTAPARPAHAAPRRESAQNSG